MTHHYFEDKPFALQFEFRGEWFTSDCFDTIADALHIGRTKVTPWRIIRRSTGAVVSRGNPVHVHTTTSPDPDEVFDIFQFERVLRHASIMALQVEVIVLEIAVMTYAVLWQESDGEQRELAQAKMVLYDALLSAAQIEIAKRLQSQYVAVCEN